jgi:hypothetical protein
LHLTLISKTFIGSRVRTQLLHEQRANQHPLPYAFCCLVSRAPPSLLRCHNFESLRRLPARPRVIYLPILLPAPVHYRRVLSALRRGACYDHPNAHQCLHPRAVCISHDGPSFRSSVTLLSAAAAAAAAAALFAIYDFSKATTMKMIGAVVAHLLSTPNCKSLLQLCQIGLAVHTYTTLDDCPRDHVAAYRTRHVPSTPPTACPHNCTTAQQRNALTSNPLPVDPWPKEINSRPLCGCWGTNPSDKAARIFCFIPRWRHLGWRKKL